MATVIDAFLVTLGLDPKEFDKAIKQVINDQDKLRKESEKTAEHMQEQGDRASLYYGKLISAATQLFAFLAAGTSLKSFIQDETQAEIEASRLAKTLRVNIETLGAWQNAAVIAGGSAESFNQSIKAINTNFNGFGSRRDPINMLTQIADKMQRMNDFHAMRYGTSIGLDEHTVRLLQRGADGVNKLVEEGKALGVVTQKQADDAKELDEVQRRISISGQEIGRTIMHMLMPALKIFANGVMAISNWARQHSQVVKAAFIGIAAAITILGVQAAIAAVSMLPITLTVLAIAAAVALVAAGITWLYLEWKKWTSGGASSMAKFFTFVMGIWDKIKNYVTTVFNVIWQTVKDYIDAVKAYFQLFWALITFDGAGVKDAWEKLTTALGRIMKRLFNYLLYELGFLLSVLVEAWDAAWTKMKNIAKDVMESVMKWWRELNPAIRTLLTVAPVTSGFAMGMNYLSSEPKSSAAIRPSSISTSTTGDTRSIQINEINVNAPQATDAQGIASSMGDALKKEDLIASTDSGS
jgi:hypothetical protein